MAKPTLVYKFATEGNPFGEKIITNVAEVVAWMRAGIGDDAPIPEGSYVTESNVTCEKQIVNLTEVVQWMYDNWQGEKGVAPVLDYATVGVKPFGVISMRNLSEVVEAIFNQMEDSGEEEEPSADEYVLVDKSVTTAPEEGVVYYVKDGDEFVPGGVNEDGDAWADPDEEVYVHV